MGASYGDTANNETGKERSKENIQKVMKFLEDKNVDVISATIMDIQQPRCLVVDPETFEFTEASPRANPNMFLANGILSYASFGRPLNLAFDLTSSEMRAPITLERYCVGRMYSDVLDKDIADIAKLAYKSGAPIHNATLRIECELQMGNAYKEAFSSVNQVFEEKLASLQQQGINIEQEQIDKFSKALRRCPIRVGENAELANDELTDFIKNKAFKITENSVSLNTDNLIDFEFSGQAYDALEARVKEEKMLRDVPEPFRESVRAFNQTQGIPTTQGAFTGSNVPIMQNLQKTQRIP